MPNSDGARPVRRRVGNYLIEGHLDAGAMGSVYRARHRLTEVEVALKLLHGPADEITTTRFLREVRAAARIGHPGVVKVLDAGRTPEGQLYLAMELLRGQTLRAALEQGLSPAEGLRLVALSLPALAAAHRAGIVHRDLKPENLYLVAGADACPVKVLDFGIALELSAPASTRTGCTIGTPYYMSPEQARASDDVGPPTDVWALGILIYEVLSATLPFDGDTASSVVVKLCTEPHADLRELLPELDPRLPEIVDRCLAKDPAQRFADAAELAAALAPLLAEPALTGAGYVVARPARSGGATGRTASLGGTTAASDAELALAMRASRRSALRRGIALLAFCASALLVGPHVAQLRSDDALAQRALPGLTVVRALPPPPRPFSAEPPSAAVAPEPDRRRPPPAGLRTRRQSARSAPRVDEPAPVARAVPAVPDAALPLETALTLATPGPGEPAEPPPPASDPTLAPAPAVEAALGAPADAPVAAPAPRPTGAKPPPPPRRAAPQPDREAAPSRFFSF